MKAIIIWSAIFVFLILCILLKRRVRWGSGIILTFAITFFSLLSPKGKVLSEFWGFRITSGALETGLFKSGILIFLQLLSKILITSKIHIPGKIGTFITSVFSYYQKLTEQKFTLEEKNLKGLTSAIDKKLLYLWNEENL